MILSRGDKMNTFNLENILDLKKWQDLQDSLAEVTNLAILTTNYKGVPITRHSRCSEFCRRVRDDKELAKRCQKCDSRGGFEAVCSNKPYIYLCHYGIVDIAIPISVDEKYLGAILAGQVKLSDHESAVQIEQLHSSPTGMSALQSSLELQESYSQLPYLSYEQIYAISNMLFHLCNYIVEEAKNKNYLLDMYETLSKAESSLQTDSASTLQEFDTLKNSLSNAISNAYIENKDTKYHSAKNALLASVIDYIYSNRSKMLSLTEAAALIHLSPGYFSRLFAKEFGQTYTSYLIHLKIEWAKQLLTKTNLSVTQISDELGFTDPSYFIKTFKKEENVTPLTFRKYSCE